MLDKGRQLIDAGRYADAEQVFRVITNEDPGNPIAWFYLGNVLRYQDRHDESEAPYRQSIQIDPSDPDTWNNLGISLGHLDRLGDADARLAFWDLCGSEPGA